MNMYCLVFAKPEIMVRLVAKLQKINSSALNVKAVNWIFIVFLQGFNICM